MTDTTRRKAYLNTKMVKSLKVRSALGESTVSLSSLGPNVIGCLLIEKRKSKDAFTEIEYDD